MTKTNTNQLTKSCKMTQALDVMAHSLHKRDAELRLDAKATGCEAELDDLKYHLLQYLQELRDELVNP